MENHELDWDDLQRHFLAALSLPPGEREAYLDVHCPGEDLRREVEGLLGALEAGEDLLGTSLIEGSDDQAPGQRPVVEGFTIGSELGRGGMGIVYEALQQKPKRSVALKIMAGGLYSSSIPRRFEREAQLLARLQHPGIAQIYGAGVAQIADRTVPYFAMELVEGRSLLRFAEDEHLNLAERLLLMAKICDAVQHAHQRGVIHRDLKPSNILVTPQGQTKILDFGVARSTDSDLLRATLTTDLGQLIGTLPYMSPEQTTGNPEALDTRSDVYALGVLCYELLAGRLPYEVRRDQLVEAVRVIQLQDPAPLREWSSEYRGDVETIVNKALEKDPDRRYGAASELAADIRRYLANQPIEARPASRFYQLQKFGQRHRALVGSLVALLVVLSVAVIATTKLALDRQTALVQTTEAKAEALRGEANARALLSFLEVDVLGQASPFVPVDRNLSLAQALMNAAHALDGRFPREPALEFSLRMTLARTLKDLSHFEEARGQGARALELAQAGFEEGSVETRAAERLLGEIDLRLFRFGPAEERLRNLANWESDHLAVGDADRLRTLGVLADLLRDKGDLEEASETFLQVLDLSRDHGVLQVEERWILQRGLGSVRMAQGKFKEARGLLDQVHGEQAEGLGADHPATLDTENSLAILLKDAGEFQEAVELCEALIPRCERVFGVLHANTLSCKTVLAGAYQNLGRFQEAYELELANLADQEQTLGPESVECHKTRGLIADALLRLGRPRDAREYAERSLEGLLATVGESHYFTMLAVGRMGSLHDAEGKIDEAIAFYEQAIEIATELFGGDHTHTANYYHNLASKLEAKGNLDGAVDLYLEAVDINSEQLGETHPNVLTSKGALAGIHLRRNELQEAQALYREVIDGFEDSVGPDFWIRGSSMLDYAECLRREGELEEALPVAEEATEILEKNFGPDHIRTKQAKAYLKQLEQAAG